MKRRVLIIGTGLIGASIGLALKKTGRTSVVGYDTNSTSAEQALAAGAVDELAGDLPRAAAGCDVVIVATPIAEIVPSIELIASRLKEGAIVTDVGSTKGTIVSDAQDALPEGRWFVGGHPMAGTEGEGVESASDDLFDEALWILTPTERTSSEAYRAINTMVSELGAKTLALEPGEHDRLVALVSHLPYAIATSLMASASQDADGRLFRAAAGSFRDVTRTAGSNPRIWRDIFTTNRRAIVERIDEFAEVLRRLRDAVSEERWDEFEVIVQAARQARRQLPAKGERAPAEPVTVQVAIPDRAGVLAEVTMAVGQEGINIEDLWVDHTAAGGVLHLEVDGRAVAERATEVLESRGFRASTVEER